LLTEAVAAVQRYVDDELAIKILDWKTAVVVRCPSALDLDAGLSLRLRVDGNEIVALEVRVCVEAGDALQ